MRIQFGTHSYQHRSLQVSAQRMVNCYAEPVDGSDTDVTIVSAYGIKAFSTPGTGPIRGGKVINGVPYVVSGTAAYSISSNGTATSIGTVPGSGFVWVDGDGVNIAFVTTDGLGYYYNGTPIAQITDSDFPDAAWLGVLDGYFIAIERGSGRLFVSDNRNPAVWNALDFATAEKYPDDLRTGIIDHGEFIGFGKESIETFYNSGNADFPLDRVPSGAAEVGCEQPYSVAKTDNSVFFHGADHVVYRLNGYIPQRISTHVVEQFLENNKDDTFYGFTFAEGGHKFYALSCSAGCFVFDIATGRWHERESYGQAGWRPRFAFFAYGRWLIGAGDSNELGELDPDTFTEYGDVLRCSATSAPFTADNKRVTHDRLELVFERGVGLISGQGSNPLVMIDYSDDRGKTWSNEITRSLGAIGVYEESAAVHRLGQSKGRVYRYAISDPVRRTLIQATLEARTGGY